MMQKTLLAAALALPFAAGAADAGGLSYHYLDGGYQKSTQRYGTADDLDADGYYLNGRALIAPNVYLDGTYDHATTDKVAGGYGEFDTFRLGAGVRTPLNANLDWTVGAGGIFAKAEPKGTATAAFTEDDDTGYYLNTGLRAMVLPALEVNGGVEYSKVFEESETTATVGTVFNVTPSFGVLGTYAFGDDLNTYRLGARWNF